jgi:hypothetical protein
VDLEAIFGIKAKPGGSEAPSFSPPPEVMPPSAVSVLPSSESEPLLNRLRDEVARLERVDFGGNLPAPLAHVLADAVVIAESYAANQEAEAARGWDALQLLRGMVPYVRRCVGNWRAMNRT